MSEKSYHVAVIIVSFGNPNDVSDCLNSLALATPSPSFDVFICENGGTEAFRELNGVLAAEYGPCDILSGNRAIPNHSLINKFTDLKCLTLKGRSTIVWTACASGNLGYAGAINAWIHRLQNITDWDGLWILNPDTQPCPDALAQLVQHANTYNKGMVASTLVDSNRDLVHNRGLRWSKFWANGIGIGYHTSVRAPYDLNAIEAVIDSPSGASMYVTRACVEHIGPMDDRFFLYFEDMDWGIRAKQLGIGYAGQSIVAHEGGRSIGKSSASRADRSELSVYLENRNRQLFIQKHYPWLSIPSSFLSLIYVFMYLLAGSPKNFKVALQGLFAGWIGETGRPSNLSSGHLRAICSNIPAALHRKAKLAISAVYYCGIAVWRKTACIVGHSPAPRLIILYYHGIEDSYRFEFARQMDMLLGSAKVVPADFQGPLSLKKPAIAITFDDAFESVVDNALPELARRSFHSTIFVPVGFMGAKPNWMTEDASLTSNEAVMTAAQLKALSPGLVTLGSHGIFHVPLPKIDKDSAKYEIEGSRYQLQDHTGREVNLFAFPYGECDKWSIDYCSAAGYKHVYSTNFKSVDIGNATFERGRVKANVLDSKIEFFLKINGAYGWLPIVSIVRKLFDRKSPTI